MKIEHQLEDKELRTHSCHVMGSQLLIVGGAEPGGRMDPNATCAPSLLQIFDMSELSVGGWTLDIFYES